MSDELNMTLPPRKGDQPKSSILVPLLLVLVLAFGVANIIINLSTARRSAGPTTGNTLSAGAQRELALKLEKQGLHSQAAQAWKDYLNRANTNSAEAAKVWYRVAKLYQQANEYAPALESFYRSESIAKVDELAPEISRRIQECLEGLGKFAALRYELSDRVDAKPTPSASGEEILAEIGPEKITKAQLDKQIERQIEMQISQFAAYLPPEQLKKQKEQLFNRLSSPAQRRRMLERLITQELLYRRARELKVADRPTTRMLLAQAEKSILARSVLEKELTEQIKITPGDLETYYQANKTDYVEPEKAKISLIRTKDETAAEKILTQLRGGKDFAELAKSKSLDKTTAEKGGKIDQWIKKGSSIPGIGQSADATAAIFSTNKGSVIDKPIKVKQGVYVIKVDDRQEERQKTFEEVKMQVLQALRAQKEREVQQKLLQDLRTRYDVVIHESAFSETPAESGRKDDNQPSTKNNKDQK